MPARATVFVRGGMCILALRAEPSLLAFWCHAAEDRSVYTVCTVMADEPRCSFADFVRTHKFSRSNVSHYTASTLTRFSKVAVPSWRSRRPRRSDTERWFVDDGRLWPFTNSYPIQFGRELLLEKRRLQDPLFFGITLCCCEFVPAYPSRRARCLITPQRTAKVAQLSNICNWIQLHGA